MVIFFNTSLLSVLRGFQEMKGVETMKRTLCYVWVMALVALWLNPAFAEGDDPVVVRVGEVTFTKSQVQSAIDSDISLVEKLGQLGLTDEEKQAQRDNTIERFIGVGLIEMKLREAGKNDFTKEEEENLKAAARNQYEQLWQGLWQRAQDSGEDFTEDQITEFMEDEGYTPEAIYEEFKVTERRYRVLDLYCPNLTLTEDMIEEYYRNQFLTPDRERYENDLELYEREILVQKNESFYTPEGYRAIQQILLAYPEELEKKLKDERARLNRAKKLMSEALQNLTAAGTVAENWDDMVESRKAYDAALEELQSAQSALSEKRKRLAQPLVQDTVEAIREAHDAGIDFGSLIDRYSTDKNAQNTEKGGYPVHPDSKNWPEDFIKAAMSLKSPGDISEPVYSDTGIHILCYASDIPAGEHELTGEERETLNASALNYYQNQELEKLMTGWREEYEIETHPELLDD